jgi:hypothetical protein
MGMKTGEKHRGNEGKNNEEIPTHTARHRRPGSAAEKSLKLEREDAQPTTKHEAYNQARSAVMGSAIGRLERAAKSIPLALRQHARCVGRLYEARHEGADTALVQATIQMNVVADQLEACLAMLQSDPSQR